MRSLLPRSRCTPSTAVWMAACAIVLGLGPHVHFSIVEHGVCEVDDRITHVGGHDHQHHPADSHHHHDSQDEDGNHEEDHCLTLQLAPDLADDAAQQPLLVHGYEEAATSRAHVECIPSSIPLFRLAPKQSPTA